MAWTEVRRSDSLKGCFIDTRMTKKREGWKTKVVFACKDLTDSALILIFTKITRKMSRCVPCLNNLSVKTGSTGQQQLSHLTPKQQESANGTVMEI